MLLDQLAGRRVSLRYRRDGHPPFSDAVGELTVDDDTATVATRRGPVQVRRSAVVAVRAVPPAPPRRASWAAVARLEGLCADAWPALVDQRLGSWRLRAAGGYSAGANGALAVGDAGMPVAAALDVLRVFAAAHGIPARVSTPAGSPWEKAVRGEGYVVDVDHAAGTEVAVLVTELAEPSPSSPTRSRRDPDSRGWWIGTAERPDEDWWSLCLHGAPPTAAQRHVLDPGGVPRTAFVLARDGAGTAVGQVRATVVEDHLHLSMLSVAPAARRRGSATALIAASAGWGRSHGARFGVLQVALRNTAAVALYRGTGWTEHHRYRHLVPAG